MPTRRFGISAFDSNGRIIYNSHLVGSFSDVEGEVAWMNSSDARVIKDAFMECLASDTPQDLETSTLDADGTLHSFRYTFHPIPSGCRVVSVWREPYNGEALTERELTALRHLSEGITSGEIPATMGLSERTAQGLLQSARDKLDARTTTQAVALATRYGLI